ncbi:PD40 domain-containing protein [Pseudoalteromonas luteoviolacea]|uniref:TolB family protein n=1 Tax=Pseudoalteromonas luteoviolacea TaxID=43657 RepID=UPI001B3659D2|nr:DUF5050 domain-containing protein [Pseudoalteromonas luteoviolacea]MBQ4810220.1 PD40 domain-containing protein [Pseudoalteromonas luteoviolacea]
MKTTTPKRLSSCVVISVLLSGCAAVQSANSTPYKLVYSSLESKNRSIYLSDESGQQRLRVVNATKADGYPAVSPNGQHIAFYGKYDKFKTWSIHVVDIDGTNLKRLTTAKYKWDSAPSWSADGNAIMFTREYKNDKGQWQEEIWTMKPDGSEQRQLPNLLGGGASFVGNTKVLFHTHAKPSQIAMANLDGSEFVTLTHDDADNRAPSLSPDGSQIVYLSNRDGNQEVYSMNVKGENHTRLTFNKEQDWSATWSVDGQHIFFTSENQTGFLDVFKMRRDGSAMQKILNNGSQISSVSNVNAQALENLIRTNQ